MSKRIKIVREIIETREEMERTVGEIAALVIDRDAMTAEMEGRLQDIRAEYEARLLENTNLTETKLAIAQDWAERNRDAFGKAKSIEGVHAAFGFRTGMPKLKTIAGWTWDAVKAWLLNHGGGYTRTEVSVNKEEIIADREKLTETGLRKMGMKVVQDESFFVEPKRELQTQG
jgi:phage host-nuclease inhibitor protein Gam